MVRPGDICNPESSLFQLLSKNQIDMKKFFTLLAAAALTLSASAVELTVSVHEGQLLSNGNVLFNVLEPNFEQMGLANIHGLLTIDADESVEATTTVTLLSGESSYGFCFDNCVGLSVGQSTSHTATIAPGNPEMISVEPQGMGWDAEEIRTYVAEVKVNATSDNALLKEFQILISNDTNASVRRVGIDNGSFTVSGNYITWNLTEAPGVLNIYTLNGQLIDQQRLSGLSGSRQLLLPAGLYIWSTPTASGKIYIRR